MEIAKQEEVNGTDDIVWIYVIFARLAKRKISRYNDS